MAANFHRARGESHFTRASKLKNTRLCPQNTVAFHPSCKVDYQAQGQSLSIISRKLSGRLGFRPFASVRHYSQPFRACPQQIQSGILQGHRGVCPHRSKFPSPPPEQQMETAQKRQQAPLRLVPVAYFYCSHFNNLHQAVSTATLRLKSFSALWIQPPGLLEQPLGLFSQPPGFSS